MKCFIVSMFLVLLARASVSPSSAQTIAPNEATTKRAASGILFGRMLQVNAGLKSYKADLHVEVELKSFVTLNQSLDGNVYYKRPDRQAVVFQVVPALASQFKKLYARIEPPSLWEKVYQFELLSDTDGVSTFRLVPRKHGRVERLDVKVDDETATIRGYVWTYEDGGFIAFDQIFTTVDGYYLVRGQTGDIELPSYKATVKSSLTHYRLNIAVDEALFKNDDS